MTSVLCFLFTFVGLETHSSIVHWSCHKIKSQCLPYHFWWSKRLTSLQGSKPVRVPPSFSFSFWLWNADFGFRDTEEKLEMSPQNLDLSICSIRLLILFRLVTQDDFGLNLVALDCNLQFFQTAVENTCLPRNQWCESWHDGPKCQQSQSVPNMNFLC